MAWFSKKPRIAVDTEPADRTAPSRMEGLWAKCEACDEILYRQELEKNWNVCPLCNQNQLSFPMLVNIQHFRLMLFIA